MRIHANLAMMDSIVECSKTLDHGAGDKKRPQTNLIPASQQLDQSFARLKVESEALLLEIACSQKIAQRQLDIVSCTAYDQLYGLLT